MINSRYKTPENDLPTYEAHLYNDQTHLEPHPYILTSPLNPRILLINIKSRIISIPRITILFKSPPINQRLNLTLPLQKLQRKPFIRMPPNMTMHKPCPRIIRLKRNKQKPIPV